MHGETAFEEADLHAFVDGRIEPSRAAALAGALGSDPDAVARIEAWRRQTESLRTMFASVLCEPVPVRLLPTAVPSRIRASCGASTETSSAVAAPVRRLAGVVATTATGAALVGFALGALASVGTDGFGLAPTAARDGAVAGVEARDLGTRAAEAHRSFLTDPMRPFDMAAGDAAKVTRWIGRRLGASQHVPDLARQGWTFVGGRVVPGRHGPAAFLAYDDGAERLGLLLARAGSGGANAARVTASDDATTPLGVATWTDGEFAYALTSDRGREWLARNLAPLRDAVRAQARASAEDTAAP